MYKNKIFELDYINFFLDFNCANSPKFIFRQTYFSIGIKAKSRARKILKSI